MKQSKLLSVGLIVCIGLFVLTASIAAPILFRPFYYAQIGPLGLEAATGLTRVEIIQAYDEMLSFCIGISNEFSTGVLKWSDWGRSHFVDVRRLFLLDLGVMASSGLALLTWALLRRKVKVKPYAFRHRNAGFWAGSGLLGAFVMIGGLATLDFTKAFEVFHTIFFPGKENWVFSPSVDEIIQILPEAFFRNCGILIIGLIVISCIGLIAVSLVRKQSLERKNERE